MKIVELKPAHLEEACAIFAATCRKQCALVPALDEDNAEAGRVLPKLEWCLGNHQGVAAFEKDQMIGYMTGFYMEEFLGVHKGVYCPEWAHGSKAEGAFGIYRQMYQEMGQIWVADGCLTHAVNTLNCDGEARDAFFWNGFGSICIDAMREVKPNHDKMPNELQIEAVKEKDIPVWLSMITALDLHLLTSPVFKPYPEENKAGEEKLAGWLGEPGKHAWIAWLGDKPAGFMQVASVGEGTAWLVGGRDKFAVNGAYVYPEFRGKGVAAALLKEVLDWAGKQGFVRCSVDFEATNLEACNFWLRHFQPVCRSLVRRLDERILLHR